VKLLVIGSGGRESALIWKLLQSDNVEKIFFAPGNGFQNEKTQNVKIKAEDTESLLKFAADEKIDFTVVGPEMPLSLGIVDLFEKNGLKIYGPKKESAKLESSKSFTKSFCLKYSIPQAKFATFEEYEKAVDYIKSKEVSFPIVLKADGLAAGKGVLISRDFKEAEEGIKRILLQKEFGSAGNKVVIEEFLEGEECSVMAICDGEKSVLLPTARDYKRSMDNDRGENTGGMGCLSPSPIVKEGTDFVSSIKEKIIDRTLAGMKEEGHKFKGTLYAGLMLTEDGPKLLEFNVRFGDPETQVILPRLEENLLEILVQASEGNLKFKNFKTSSNRCLTVVATAKGYPASYEKGMEISGIKEAEASNAIVFHAGTTLKEGKLVTNGGRVLNVTAVGKDFSESREKAYRALSFIKFNGITYRNDIGLKIVERI
jgi:phosphoribosylamine--glycine ligase